MFQQKEKQLHFLQQQPKIKKQLELQGDYCLVSVGRAAYTENLVGSGYLFGNIPLVKNNFSIVVLGIVFVSILPMVFEVVRNRNRHRGLARRRSSGVRSRHRRSG